jgi:acyl carrier protein
MFLTTPLERLISIKMDVKTEIIAQFVQVARENDKRLAPLTNDLELLDSGLDSLCFAVIVSRLEEALGVDPFTVSDDALFPVTFGELVSFYENAAK